MSHLNLLFFNLNKYLSRVLLVNDIAVQYGIYISRIFSSCMTETLYPLNRNSPFHSPLRIIENYFSISSKKCHWSFTRIAFNQWIWGNSMDILTLLSFS